MNIDKGTESWLVNKHGKFKKQETKVDFTPVLETKPGLRYQYFDYC